MSARKGWSTRKVRDVIVHHASGPSPTCEERNIASDDEWGILKTTAVTWDGWDATAHKVPPKSYWGNRSIEVRPGDALITKAGPRNRCGVTVYVPETPPRLMVSGKMILLRPDANQTTAPYLATALATSGVQRFIDARTTGLADAQLNFTNQLLLDTEIPFAPPDEQRRIAEIRLSVDAAVLQTKALIRKMQLVKAGLMQDLLSRGIADDGRLRPVQEEAPELYQEWGSGHIPAGWTLERLGDLTPDANPICYGIVQPGEHVPDGVPVVAIYNLNSDFTATHRSSARIEQSYVRSRIRAGDVLLSIKGTIGRVDVVPAGSDGNISRDVARIRPRSGLQPAYLRYALESEPMQRFLERISVGTTRAELSIGRLKDVLVPIPPESEQVAIAEVLRHADIGLTTEREKLSKLGMLKSGLMTDLFPASGTPDRRVVRAPLRRTAANV